MHDPEDRLTVGHRIRRARENAGVSQRELARRTGLTHSSVNRIENDEVTPRAESLERICSALNIPVAYLWIYEDDKRTIVRKALIAAFHDLPETAIDSMEARILFVERKYRIKMQLAYRPIYYLGGPYRVIVFDEHWTNHSADEHLYVIFNPGGSVEGWVLPTQIVPATTEAESDKPVLADSWIWSSMEEFKSFLAERGFCWNKYPLCTHRDEYCKRS